MTEGRVCTKKCTNFRHGLHDVSLSTTNKDPVFYFQWRLLNPPDRSKVPPPALFLDLWPDSAEDFLHPSNKLKHPIMMVSISPGHSGQLVHHLNLRNSIPAKRNEQ